MVKKLYGLIETGGTKFVLAIASSHKKILAEKHIPTISPEETLEQSIAWMASQSARIGRIDAIGISSFGPIQVDKTSPDWGNMLETPKPGWGGARIVEPFRKAFSVPIGLDTDVNAAAMAEGRWGAGRNQRTVVYITVGTGIGGGAVIEGRALHGLSHPEMGHMRVTRHPEDRDFPGVCPFHRDCLEGLAAGPAIIARWGANLSNLDENHISHDIISFYVAQMCTTLQSVMEPGRIILGGGVMQTPCIIERIRSWASKLQNDYFQGKPDQVIVSPDLKPYSGVLGALVLAEDALHLCHRN
ncbi:MAG: fructokinase [Alphaproteobacteria bacterium]|nr:MAG: fructokinase [Alphaproteobacteria bacterium]